MSEQVKLFVATPMYGGNCNGSYTMGMIQMVQTCASNNIMMYFSFMQNESLITRGRNSLAHDFLNTDSTHLMFIDADIGFNPEDIVSMLKCDKEVICGLYPKKEINWVQVAEAVKHGVPPEHLHNFTGAFVVNLAGDAAAFEGKRDQPFEISNGGTGFMLIKREVFEKLADKVPEYNNDMYVAVDTERKPKVIKEFFATSIDATSGNRLLSEDYHFCKIAREIGIKIWAAPWVNLKHCGTYNFEGQLPSA